MKAEGLPQSQQNVFGEPIELCCKDPLTGFYRDGHCIRDPMIWVRTPSVRL